MNEWWILKHAEMIVVGIQLAPQTTQTQSYHKIIHSRFYLLIIIFNYDNWIVGRRKISTFNVFITP